MRLAFHLIIISSFGIQVSGLGCRVQGLVFKVLRFGSTVIVDI